MGKLRALTTKFKENPYEASRPWDTKRDGLVLSEGGALFWLSSQKTSDTIAEITGYAMTNDAYQVVAPHPEGKQIERCMRQVLKTRKPDLINAHATSTPMGDYIELDAIKRLGLDDCYITANKSQLGHMMGGAGSIETAMSILSIRDNKITPSVNIDALADGYDWVNYTPISLDKEVNSVLCNSFGFGGTNASIMLESVN
jgi:3-oxoacyl-[acyl-carrier-protein] synthase II